MNRLKGNKGITLIALIITIIVLLILAAVVISMTIGSNGIIEKSQSAVTKYSMEAAREQVMNDVITMKMDKMINQSYTMGIDDLLDTAVGGGLKVYDNKIDSVVKEDNKAIVTYDGKYVFEIDENFNVKYKETTDGVSVTAIVSGGGGWIKSGSESTVTISGKITTSQGTIQTATITRTRRSSTRFNISRRRSIHKNNNRKWNIHNICKR